MDEIISTHRIAALLYFVWLRKTIVHEAYASGTKRCYADGLMHKICQYSSLRASGPARVNGRSAQQGENQ